MPISGAQIIVSSFLAAQNLPPPFHTLEITGNANGVNKIFQMVWTTINETFPFLWTARCLCLSGRICDKSTLFDVIRGLPPINTMQSIPGAFQKCFSFPSNFLEFGSCEMCLIFFEGQRKRQNANSIQIRRGKRNWKGHRSLLIAGRLWILLLSDSFWNFLGGSLQEIACFFQ